MPYHPSTRRIKAFVPKSPTTTSLVQLLSLNHTCSYVDTLSQVTVATGTSSGPSLPPSVWSEDDSELLYETSSASVWDGDSTVIGSESYG